MIRPHPAGLRVVCVIVIVFSCLPVLTALGSEITVSPFIDVRNEYNDNLFNDVDNTTKDTVSNVSAGIDLTAATERWSSTVSAEAVAKAYADNSEFNNIDKNVSGSFRSRLTERMTFLFDAGFTADSRNDRDFEETGLIDGEQTIEAEKVIREDTVIRSSAIYAMSEITTSSLSYDITINEFDDREFSDYTSQNLSFRINRKLLDPVSNTEVFIVTDYYWYNSLQGPLNHPVFGTGYEYETDLNSISVTAGASTDLRENLTLTIKAGGRYNETSSVSKTAGTAIGENEDQGWGPMGEIVLFHNSEINSTNLSLYHNLRPRTGSGGFVKNTAARARYAHNFTENLRADFMAGFYLNKSYGKFDTDKIDEQALRIQPGLVYFFTTTLSIDCRYSYRLIHDRIDNTDISKNIVQIGISFRYPNIRQ